MPPSHFSSILLSNWQSCVAKLARTPRIDEDGIGRPALDFNNARIIAAATAADAQARAAQGEQVTLDDPQHQQAKAALDWARALVNGTGAEIAAARAVFAKFGKTDPFWAECVVEFVEHYTLTKHSAVPYTQYVNISDFVLPQSALPLHCKIAVIGDWGTGEARAQRLLEEIAAAEPDILLHLGDIYYACTSSEANTFYENCMKAFPKKQPRLLTLCGNHDMYSGAAPYYALLKRIEQPASFFCLRNQFWQFLAADTGWNDFNPLDGGAEATWIRDFDEGDSYSELAWHKDKLVNAGTRKTILLTHHQLFTMNASIEHRNATPANKPFNDYLLTQFGAYLPEIALWLWGHEHNQLIYQPYAGLERGRCLGASAIPVPASVDLTAVDPALAGADVPKLIEGDPDVTTLQPEQDGGFYQLGYAILTLAGPQLTAAYLQFDSIARRSTLMYEEVLGFAS